MKKVIFFVLLLVASFACNKESYIQGTGYISQPKTAQQNNNNNNGNNNGNALYDANHGCLSFYTVSPLTNGNINVSIQGYGTKQIQANFNAVPNCGQSGTATFSMLPQGTYTFTCSDNVRYITGNIIVASNTCQEVLVAITNSQMTNQLIYFNYICALTSKTWKVNPNGSTVYCNNGKVNPPLAMDDTWTFSANGTFQHNGGAITKDNTTGCVDGGNYSGNWSLSADYSSITIGTATKKISIIGPARLVIADGNYFDDLVPQ